MPYPHRSVSLATGILVSTHRGRLLLQQLGRVGATKEGGSANAHENGGYLVRRRGPLKRQSPVADPPAVSPLPPTSPSLNIVSNAVTSPSVPPAIPSTILESRSMTTPNNSAQTSAPPSSSNHPQEHLSAHASSHRRLDQEAGTMEEDSLSQSLEVQVDGS